MKIGAMSILFREQQNTSAHITHSECLKRMKNAGFDAADLNLCLIATRRTPLHLDDWKRDADLTAKSIEELGLSVKQCHLPFKGAKQILKTPEDHEFYDKMFYRAIDVASYLGIPWGVIHPETYRKRDWSFEEKLERNHKVNDAYIEYALSKNVNIAYENMPHKDGTYNFCTCAEELCELIDSYRDTRVGACWDTGHGNLYSPVDQYDQIVKLGSRLHAIHVHDNAGKNEDQHVPMLFGTVNWERVVSALRDVNYTGDFIMELHLHDNSPEFLKDKYAHCFFESAKYILGL